MKAQRRAITTARGVALLRAVERTRPEAERLCDDPYARAFVNPVTFASTWALVRLGILDITLPRGTVDFALAREAFVHDLMERELGDGARQLVILGAGYDTRAYRIPAAADIPIFEVDHPVTQEGKLKALRRTGVALPAGHRFVTVDFDREQLGERLAAAGYDESLRTLFVWQGVTMYLTAAGIDGTLAFIARHSAPGSVVVFDYFTREQLAGSGSAGMRWMVRAMGEPLTFGIPRDEIVAFLEARGFHDVDNADAAEIRRRQMTGVNAGRHVADGAAIVSARVRRDGQDREPGAQ